MTYIFTGLGIVMGLSLAISLFFNGFSTTNIHLTAYGFILAGLGYLIELIKKREKEIDMNLEYVIEKKMKTITEEVKSVRLMMLKLEDRRIQKDIEASQGPAPSNNHSPSGPIGPISIPTIRSK